MLNKYMYPAYRFHNTTFNIAAILHDTSVHCHQASQHVITNVTSRSKDSQPLQKAHWLLHVFPHDCVVGA